MSMMAPDMGPGPGPGGPQGPPGLDQPPSPEVLVRAMIQIGQRALQLEPDDQDSHALAKVISQLQGILATRQKEAHTATGVTPAAKYLARNQSA